MSASPEMAARDRRRVVRSIAPLVGLLAVGLLAWQGSYSAFSATTDNGTEAWTTGQMALVNNGGTAGSFSGSTAAVFGATNDGNLKPGDTRTVCITVKSTSTYAGSLRFYRGAITDVSGLLSPQINLTVIAGTPGTVDVPLNCTGFVGGTTVVNNLALTAGTFPTTYAGATPLAIGAGNVTPVLVPYKITYTFTSTGTNATDNLIMNKTASTPFNWELQ